jgi:hypothetical protein
MKEDSPKELNWHPEMETGMRRKWLRPRRS